MDLLDLSNDYVSYDSVLYESLKGNPKVLARTIGTFFVPDGRSRNDRFYSESLWKRQLNSQEVQWTLKNGMLGTLVHPVEEKMAHPIYSSHVVKKLWIDNNTKKGMGEAYVLGTPVGRIVDTLQQSKLVNLFVSSRAFGKLSDYKVEGLPAVDESNYFLKTFDYVLDPGFLEANPRYMTNESVTTAIHNLSECYFNSYDRIKLPGYEKESRAKQLLKDLREVL